MKRFVAYLLASFTILLGVGVAFIPTVTKMNADLDFRDGKELTFRLYDIDDKSKALTEEDEASKYYAEVMNERLTAYGLSDYKISTCGCDTVKVVLALNNDNEYDMVSQLLTVNPKIEIQNLGYTAESEDESVKELWVADKEGEYSWHDNSAYITYDGYVTNVVMPIPAKAKNEVKELVDSAKKYEEKQGGDKKDDEPTNVRALQDDEEEKTTPNSIILWMNRQEDEYDKKDNPDVSKKIIYDQFNSNNFYLNDDQNAFKISFNPTGTDFISLRDSRNQANLMLNLLNAKVADFNASLIDTNIINASVENLFFYDAKIHVAFSNTFIALLAAFVVTSLILIMFYKVNAISMIATMTGSTFLTFLMFTVFSIPFNLSALVALIMVAIASLITPIAHHGYFQDEVYKGRNLKKANYEASKRTTMLTVDVSVVSVILGVLLYFIGGTTVSTAGVILVTFGVINLLFNTFIHKGLNWLLTNSTKFQKKEMYHLFNIKSDKVPDLAKEEKQKYFGPFENKDYTKYKKPTAITMAVLTFVSLIGLIVFSSLNQTFNSSTQYAVTNEVCFSIDGFNIKTQTHSNGEISDYLNKITNNNSKLKYGDIRFYCYEYVANTTPQLDIRQCHNYVITINEINLESATYRYDGGTAMTLKDVFDSTLPTEFGTTTDNIRLTSNVVTNLPGNANYILLASIASVAISIVYFFIRRYKMSRILALAASSTMASLISIGVITLTRINATPAMGVAAAFTMFVSILMSLLLLNKDKHVANDDRATTYEQRVASLKKASSLAMVPVLITTAVSLYLAINFLGIGNKAFIAMFLASAIGVIAMAFMLIVLFTPAINILDSKFSTIKLPSIDLKKKDKTNKKDNSNEPEEAIFVGIND